MEKFENYHRPEHHYTHGPGAKWIERPVVDFGCPYGDSKAKSLLYTLSNRAKGQSPTSQMDSVTGKPGCGIAGASGRAA